MKLSWQDSANCASVGLDLFYDDHEYRSAIKVCRACRVLTECQEYIDTVEDAPVNVHGVWAGQTAPQRIWRRWPGTVTLHGGEGMLRAS